MTHVTDPGSGAQWWAQPEVVQVVAQHVKPGGLWDSVDTDADVQGGVVIYNEQEDDGRVSQDLTYTPQYFTYRPNHT
jgi:hypothetical protein